MKYYMVGRASEILGDLYIKRYRTENSSIRFEQLIIHKEYLKHLYDKLKYLCTENAQVKFVNRKINNVDTQSVFFVTRQLISITELHNIFYKDGKKIVPEIIETLITEVSLAYWAQDDGEKHKSGFIFNATLALPMY